MASKKEQKYDLNRNSVSPITWLVTIILHTMLHCRCLHQCVGQMASRTVANVTCGSLAALLREGSAYSHREHVVSTFDIIVCVFFDLSTVLNA